MVSSSLRIHGSHLIYVTVCSFGRVNGVSSGLHNVNGGVSRGSYLGSLLRLIYINDLPFSLQSSQFTMYADDATLSHSSNIIDVLSEKLIRDLRYLKQWLEGNKLSLKLIKTQAMVVGSQPNLKKIHDRKLQPPTFVIDDIQIEIVEKTKYFRVQLDQHLVWDEHVRFL